MAIECLRQGATISLYIWRSKGYWGRIIFCINLISPESNDQSNRGQGKDLKDLNSEQETAESDSLKRPRGNDPHDTEEESSDLVTTLTAENVPDESNSTSEPKANESKNLPRKKSKPKAKKLKPKTGREKTNTITNYFGALAAANNNSTSNPP